MRPLYFDSTGPGSFDLVMVSQEGEIWPIPSAERILDEMEDTSRETRLIIEDFSGLVQDVESLAMSYPDLKNENFSDIKSSLKAFADRHNILLERLTKRVDYLEGRRYLLDDWKEFRRDYDDLSGAAPRL
ncbi:hypothetical protein PG984_015485 [Apiospora sp. TS-2023a]